MTIEPEALRVVLRTWASGVTVVTTTHNGQRHGMTVSSFTPASLDPPHILVCIAKDSNTYPLLIAAGIFAVSLLRADQILVSNRFAARDTEHTNRFEGYETHTAVTGAPILQNCLAWLDCEVAGQLDSGTNAVFLGRVLAAEASDNQPLVYWDRNYRRFKTT